MPDSRASRRVRTIWFVPPVAAAVIAALVGYRLTRPAPPPPDPAIVAAIRPIPQPYFKLYDQHSEIVRLERYVSRHKLLVAFFDGRGGPGHSPVIREIRQGLVDLERTGAVVLTISAARPAENREGQSRSARFPFPMLSDVTLGEHGKWGVLDPRTGEPREAVFIIDRLGVIRQAHFGPDRLGAARDWAAELRSVR